ncbi:MAG TPA: oligopeptide/dipeptide ABC transporter ATP-binding protein [Victivallales bacterium]|nr:oligopeptide/dipeptide ABC transporter ATP-binding protein [Victivallales bacterium]
MALLEVNNIKKYYPIKKSIFSKNEFIKAVDSVSFKIKKGETLGLVGESGCGKSTIAKLIVKLEQPTEGRIKIANKDITDITNKQRKEICKKYQMIFQDPYSSLNPKKKIFSILDEVLLLFTKLNKEERYEKIISLVEMVGLSQQHLSKFPHQFSGGQKQRIAIARALAIEPELIIADEPVSALDVSIQAQIINLLIEIQNKTNMSYLFISHDLAVIENICDRIMVMFLGKIIEVADSETLINNPKHPYTKTLLSAVPTVEFSKKLNKKIICNDLNNKINFDNGCRFYPRCNSANEICRSEIPELKQVNGTEHYCACFINNEN